MTGLTSDLSSLGIDDESEKEPVDPETLGVDEKQIYLKELFPDVNDYTIAHTLKKNDDVVFRSIDVLLNHTFLEGGAEPGEDCVGVPRGIEAFTQGQHRPKKGKRKQHDLEIMDDSASSSNDLAPILNRWEVDQANVEKVASLIGIPHKNVLALFNEHDRSIGTTIKYIIDLETRKIPSVELLAPVEYPLSELLAKFPSLPKFELIAVLRLTKNSSFGAEELVKLMQAKPYYVDSIHPIQIVQRHAPIGPDGELIPAAAHRAVAAPTSGFASPALTDSPIASPELHNATLAGGIGRSNSTGAGPWTKVYNRRGQNVGSSFSYATAPSSAYQALADQHTISGARARASASAAARAAKSNPLMAAATAHYAQQSRAHVSSAKTALNLAAEEHVNANSTSTLLDLHGATVSQAVYIAKKNVRVWYDSLGDAGVASNGNAIGDGYRIVVGMGNHSAEGRARIKPAVERALEGEGWKIGFGASGGEIVVLGRRRS